MIQQTFHIPLGDMLDEFCLVKAAGPAHVGMRYEVDDTADWFFPALVSLRFF